MHRHFSARASAIVTAATLFAVLVACASVPDHDKATVWTLRDTASVGGHATEVVGKPRVADADDAIVFDGKGDGLFVPANPLASWSTFTIEVRFMPDGSGGAEVYDGAKMSHYVKGELELAGAVAFTPMTTGRSSIGVRQNRVSWFKGAIAEVRFTPAALPADRLRRKREK